MNLKCRSVKKWILALGAAVLCSCEKDIDFNLTESEPVLTVDGRIENDMAPVIILTKSFSYYQEIDAPLLSASFVRNAEVTMNNGTLTHKLKEYTLGLAPGISAYYYTTDSADLATAFVGELNKTYTLNILSEGQEYSARTTIPESSNFPDSVWFKEAPRNPDTNKRVMYIRATDPPGRGNYVRYFTRKNAEPFLPGENVFDDQVIDGTTYQIQLPQGINRNNPPKEDSSFYNKGDTVTLKFCAIDKATYTFWTTWEFSYQSIGNPFAQPNKVIGNISNGALGIFAGYAVGYRTVIAR